MHSFSRIYRTLMYLGDEVRPRGQATIELRDWRYNFGCDEVFIDCNEVPLNFKYIGTELLWYLVGERKDLSICDSASIWKDCVHEGMLQSNYGHYLFRRRHNTIWDAAGVLRRDPDSRQSMVIINNATHHFKGNPDLPCTMYISWHIRDNILFQHVRMRSQDAIFGLRNDLPFFQLVFRLMYGILKDDYPDLSLGRLHLSADSFHVYERHYAKAQNLADCTLYRDACLPHIGSRKEVKTILDLGNHPVIEWCQLAMEDALEEMGK